MLWCWLKTFADNDLYAKNRTPLTNKQSKPSRTLDREIKSFNGHFRVNVCF